MREIRITITSEGNTYNVSCTDPKFFDYAKTETEFCRAIKKLQTALERNEHKTFELQTELNEQAIAGIIGAGGGTLVFKEKSHAVA